MLYSAEDCFGKCSNQNTIKDGLVGPMGSRAEAVKQYKRSESKNGRKNLRLSKSRKICSITSPINPAHAVKSRRLRRSGLRLSRSAAVIAATIPVMSQTPVPHCPTIFTDMSIDGLLDRIR